jgi:GNAT superfamily N-acetyltransferase/predicted nucleic acid-binding protein
MWQLDVRILSNAEDIAAYIEQARAASDTDKESLGFLPEPAYREAAEQGKLLIATVQERDHAVYAGHLLHGGVFPFARIFQIFTLERFRRKGIGRRLVETIVRKAETLQFMSIVARVADDLTANEFWEKLSFQTVRTEAGGRTTGRKINVRVRDLDTLKLFQVTGEHAPPSTRGLGLSSRLFESSPIYVLDLNVLYDLVKNRANVEDVGRIVRASFSSVVRLAITEEFINELKRTSSSASADPILELALRLPRLPKPSSQALSKIVGQLGTVLFPKDMSAGTLRTQDQSDLVHLATAIHHKATGFITSEKTILRARGDLQSRYSLDIVGPSELAETVEPADSTPKVEVQALVRGQVLKGRPAQDNDRSLLEVFLGNMKCPLQIGQDAVRSDPVRAHRRILVTINGAIVGFGSWEIPSAVNPRIQAFVCVDENRTTATLTADFLLDSVSRESMSGYPLQLNLRLLPGHVITKRIAISHGFRPSASESSKSTELQKIALGTAVTSENWASLHDHLKKQMRLELPESIPHYYSPTQGLTIHEQTGQSVSIPPEGLETLLSPAIFLLLGRPAAIVPIRRAFADDLIGGAAQLNMLAGPEAVLFRERAYFSHPRTTSVLRKGVPILFYESAHKGGRASIIAAARIVRTEIISKKGANEELLRRGVLDRNSLKNISLADTAAATTIDNIMVFKNPIGLDRLRALGAVDRANLVTARTLQAEQVATIVNEGMP